MNYTELLLTLGISDVSAFLTFIAATSKTGPNFKAAASGAIASLQSLATAAETPAV